MTVGQVSGSCGPRVTSTPMLLCPKATLQTPTLEPCRPQARPQQLRELIPPGLGLDVGICGCPVAGLQRGHWELSATGTAWPMAPTLPACGGSSDSLHCMWVSRFFWGPLLLLEHPGAGISPGVRCPEVYSL